MYAFSSEYKTEDRIDQNCHNKLLNINLINGIMADVRLICLANNRCKKKELDESLIHFMDHMSMCYTDRYTHHLMN